MQVPWRLPAISICNCLHINSTFSEDATFNNFHTRQRSSGSCQPPKVTALSYRECTLRAAKVQTRNTSEKDEEQQLCNSKPSSSCSGFGITKWQTQLVWDVCTSCLHLMSANVKNQGARSNNNQFPSQNQLARAAGKAERVQMCKMPCHQLLSAKGCQENTQTARGSRDRFTGRWLRI